MCNFSEIRINDTLPITIALFLSDSYGVVRIGILPIFWYNSIIRKSVLQHFLFIEICGVKI